MIAYPLGAQPALLAGENVEAHLRPFVETLGDLDGFVFGAIGGSHAAEGLALAVGGEVRVQLDHGAARSLRFRAVNLNFIVALGARHGDGRASGKEKSEKQLQGRSLHRVLSLKFA